MGILQTVRSFFAGSKARVPLGKDFVVGGIGEASYADYNLGLAKKAGYTGNEIFYAAMQVIISAYIQSPLKVWDGTETIISNHPFRKFIRRPNPFMTEERLWELTLIHLFLTGNCFKVKYRNKSNTKVVEEWILDPTRVRIIPSQRDFISHYTYEIGGQKIPILPEDMIHHKFESPDDPYFGVSPFYVAFKQIQVDNEANDMTKAVLENKAMPGIVITTQEELDQDRANLLKARWKQSFGKGKRGEPAFLQKGMEIHDFPVSMKDLSFPDLRDISETRICAVVGVPPILVGIRLGLSSGTYSNAKQFRQLLYENRVCPLQKRISSDYMAAYEKDFDLSEDKAELRHDLSRIPSLREWRNEIMDQLDKGVRNGSVRRAEYRRAMNLEVSEADEGFYIPNSARFVSAKVKPADKLEAPPRPATPSLGKPTSANRPEKPKGGVDLITPSILRIDEAQRFLNSLLDWAKGEFVSEELDILEAINSSIKGIDFDALDVALVKIFDSWVTRISETVFPIMSAIARSSMDSVSMSLGVGLIPADEEIEFIRNYSIHFAREISKTTEDALRAILLESRQAGKPVEWVVGSIKEKFLDWSEDRAMLIARTEIIRTSNAGAVMSFQKAGVKKYEWLTTDSPCPYCAPLNGKTVEMGANFFNRDDVYQPSEDVNPIKLSYSDVAYPPLHPNCRCTVVPVVD